MRTAAAPIARVAGSEDSMAFVTSALRLPVSADETFAFHADVRNLPRLTPPPGARLLTAPAPTRAGDVQVIEIGPRVFPVRWVAHIVAFEPPRLMIDEQRRGPFKTFRHAHIVIPDGDGSVLVDAVEFQFFDGPGGALLDQLLVAPLLRLLFAARRRRTRALLAAPKRGVTESASMSVGR